MSQLSNRTASVIFEYLDSECQIVYLQLTDNSNINYTSASLFSIFILGSPIMHCHFMDSQHFIGYTLNSDTFDPLVQSTKGLDTTFTATES